MNTAEQTQELRAALTSHDYSLAAELAQGMTQALQHGQPISDEDRRGALDQLRKKRIFGPLTELARALIAAGRADARVRRQLAQALIERGALDEAEGILRALAQSPDTEAEERVEAVGLIGRVNKQRYVDGSYASGQGGRVLLDALAVYLKEYENDPAKNYWHGINAVSLAKRAERDQVPVHGDFDQIAADILRRIEEKAPPDLWEMATAAEAAIALGRIDLALTWVNKYTAEKNADVFELSSTTRQFLEVLELDRRPECAPIIDRLRTENLKRSGGGFIPMLMDAAVSAVERSASSSDEPVRVPMLLQVSDPSWQPDHIPDLIVTSRIGLVIAALGSQRSVDSALADPQVVALEASRPGGSLETALSLPQIGADRVPPQPDVSASNVLVAILDGGVDILHEAFLDKDGKSRIIAYWDQADPTGPGPSELPNCKGTLHDAEAIAGYVAKRQLPTGMSNGPMKHGTHVASIAAGQACGAFKGGVAPDAKLIVVKSKTSVDPGDPLAVGYSLAHQNALAYIDIVARREGTPVVVNISQGQNAGAHDGTSLLEKAIDEFTRHPGRVVVKSAGNERDKNGHAKVTLPPYSQEQLEFRVSPQRVEPVLLEVWFRSGNDLTFRLLSPTGDASPMASPTEQEVSGKLASGNKCKLSYDSWIHDNGDSRLRLMIDAGSADSVVPGDWKLEITSGDISEGEIHAWFERGAYKDLEFRNHANEEMTLSIPGTAKTVITVGAIEISGKLRNVGSFSSYGRTRDNREKPDICAPGVNISAAAAGTRDGVVVDTGTSMAAPHVTGAVALLLARKPKLNGIQVQSMLRFSATPGKFDPGQGYGLLDIPRLLALK